MIDSIYFVRCDRCGATGPEVRCDEQGALSVMGKARDDAVGMGWQRAERDDLCPDCFAKSRMFTPGQRVVHTHCASGTVRDDDGETECVLVDLDKHYAIWAVRASLSPEVLTEGK